MTEIRNAREAALKIVTEVEGGAYTDRALTEALRAADLDVRDRRLVTELVNGVLRMRGHVDWILQQFAKGGIERLSPVIRNALRLGAYQILFLNKVPEAVAVNETVNLAKRFGHQGTANFLNAVLRRIVRREFQYPSLEGDPVIHISVVYSHPRWLVKRWIKRFGVQEARDLCQANNRVPDAVFRVNPLKVSQQEAVALLASEGLEVRPSPHISGYVHVRQAGELLRHRVFQQGWFSAQDESAGFASLLLDPQPGERVLDLCCAPGGKTSHVAQLMQNRGTLVGVDINEEKLRLVDENCRRLGIDIMEAVHEDGTHFISECFDRVLVDAPCSGTGVLTRRTDARWRKTEQQILDLVDLQRKLVENGVKLLKEGGVLVYSTCSIEEEENEEVVQDIRNTYGGLDVEDARSFIPEKFVTSKGFVRTFPHRHGIDGSFAVRLRKRC